MAISKEQEQKILTARPDIAKSKYYSKHVGGWWKKYGEKEMGADFLNSPNNQGYTMPAIKDVDTSNLKDLQGRVLATLTPSEGETSAQKGLSDLISSKELGLAKAGQQPIETGFVTGQKKAITERAALQSLPLEAQLAQLQARRQAASDVLKTSLGYEQSEITRQQSSSEKQQTLNLQVQQLREQARQFGVSEERLKESGAEALAIQGKQFEAQQALEREKLAEQSRQFGVSLSKIGLGGSSPTTTSEPSWDDWNPDDPNDSAGMFWI